MTSKKNLIAIRIEENMKNKLDELAAESKCTVSDYIRQALKENIDLIEKQRNKIGQFGFEGAMFEIYINTKYKHSNIIMNESEKIFYSNMLIDILLKEVNQYKEKKLGSRGLNGLLCMKIIKENIKNCSKYTSEQNKKLYDLLYVAYEERDIDKLFSSYDKYENENLNNTKEIENQRNIVKNITLDNLKNTVSDIENIDDKTVIKNIDKIKELYIENKIRFYVLEERKLSKQFEYIIGDGDDVYEDKTEILDINSQIRECVFREESIEEFLLILLNRYISIDYEKWSKLSKKYTNISSMQKSQIKQLLVNKDHWEVESQIDFENLIRDIEIEVIF